MRQPPEKYYDTLETVQDKKTNLFDKLTQILLPVLTIAGFMFTSFKNPKVGLIFNLAAQIFWFYSAYQSWKRANQIGILITTSVISLFLIYGVINYWFLS